MPHPSRRSSPSPLSPILTGRFGGRPVPRLLATFFAAAMMSSISCGGSGSSVEVLSLSPEGEVTQTTNFTLRFSEPVIPDSLVGSTIDSLSLRFDPPIPGERLWIARDKIRFFPEAMLRPSTQYRMALSPALFESFGRRLEGNREFSFHTPRFRVLDARLLYEFLPDRNDKARLLGTVRFNFPVDPAEASRNMELQYDDGESIVFAVAEKEPSTVITIRADEVRRDAEEAGLSLIVRAGLDCMDGGLPLERDHREPLTLPGQVDLRVERVYPSEEPGEKPAIAVDFNLPVSRDQAVRFVVLDPPVEITVTAGHRRVTLRGDFEAGKTYRVSFGSGLRAVDGSPISRDFSTSVVLRGKDIPPQIGWRGDGFYLTRGGLLNIALETINVDSVSLQVNQIFPNNLVHLLDDVDPAAEYGYYSLRSLGREVKRFGIPIADAGNAPSTTPLSVAEILDEHGWGVYQFVAYSTETRWRRAMRWVVATDIGLTAKESGDRLLIWANSLLTLDPIADAEIRLLSRNNQLLATARTDAEGIAVLEPPRDRTEDFTPYLITAAHGDDYSFLELDRRILSTGSFDVDGRPSLTDGYDAFLYTERGVYRPGETAALAAFLRGPDLLPPTPFPVRLAVVSPDGRILSEQRGVPNDGGAVEFLVPLPEHARTGGYTAMLNVGEETEIGRVRFSVEDFIPDRMKASLHTSKDEYEPGDTMAIDVEALTLFGPPAAGRRVDASVEIVDHDFTPPGWEGFVFRDRGEAFPGGKFPLGEALLDEEGRHRYLFAVPGDLRPPAGLRGILSATVLEPGGRGVTAYRAVLIHPHPRYVGLRRSSSGYAERGKPVEIEYALVAPDGRPLEGRSLRVTFHRVVWQSILRDTGQRGYRYVSERVEEPQREFSVTTSAGVASFTVTPEDYGSFLVVTEDPETGAAASIGFYASGWGYAPWAMDRPDRVELDLDRDVYRTGDTAKLQIRAPFSGKLLLTVERERVLSHRILTLSENTAMVEIPVREEYLPNVYLSAHLIHSTENLEPDTPIRAFGVIPLKVDTEDRRLAVELEAPDVILPERELTVDFRVNGLRGRAADVTIAAVDEGICRLTDFQTPDPHAHFLGRRRLLVRSHDLYGAVLPEFEPLASSSSGDVETARKRQLSPVAVQRVRPVSFWSGLVRTDDRGHGRVTFPIPEFAGTIRLMAAAAADDRFGGGENRVIVRRPIQMTPTFPRFLAGGDRFTVPVAVYNGTGAESEIAVRLDAHGPARIRGAATARLSIPDGTEDVAFFEVEADEGAGEIEFLLTAEGGGERSEIRVKAPLRPPAPMLTLAGSGVVTDSMPASFVLPGDWIEGSADFSLSLSSFPAVRFGAGLQYLLRYPHGCLEQKVSGLFPLLYFDDLARLVDPALFGGGGGDYYVAEGIAEIESMQLPDGAFSYWPGGGHVNDWCNLYAIHFLIEARRNGYTVTDRVYDRMVRLLPGYARMNSQNKDREYALSAYACYLASLAGAPERASMNFLLNSTTDRLADYSLYQLAGAFALAGDMVTAHRLLPKSAAPTSAPEEAAESGGILHSPVRGTAICLDVLAEVDPRNPVVPVLVRSLTDAAEKNRRWETTQENAFALLALGKIMRTQQGDGSFRGVARIDGRELGPFDNRGDRFAGRDWGGGEVSLDLTGNGVCYYYWRADGIPSGRHIEEYDRDIEVRRRYLDEEGVPIRSDAFRQGDLVVAEVTVRALSGDVENVAVVDLLPAGLEIENPRLQSRRALTWIDKKTRGPVYMDFRDDRIVFYGDLRQGETEKYYYGLRAVTAGEFTRPPVRAEAMYAPMKSSVASGGRITVRPAD
ncbi:MAG: Ig-like domain-containing protein [Candidatus Eisenbacteria bacterium]|nr:Ig-like domain-containing protein [Candidatus Eisenbacteria bacterium]